MATEWLVSGMTTHFQSKANISFRLRSLDLKWEQNALGKYSEFFAADGNSKPDGLQRWRHLQNPAGDTFAVIAQEDSKPDTWAALYVTSPVVFDVAGKQILGSQSLDTLTGSAYRGHGLFPRLAQEVYGTSETTGVHFVYGFPNASSAPGFFGRLEWTNLGSVPFLIKPLRVSYFSNQLARRLGLAPTRIEPGDNIDLSQALLATDLSQFPIERLERFDEEATRLWERNTQSTTVGVRRDAKYLNWRLFDRPDAHYCVLGHKDAHGINGYVAFAGARKHGGTIGYILELIVSPDRPAVAASLLKAATRILRTAGADAVLAWCLPHSSPYSTFRWNGYWPLPERLRPIELHFGVRSFDPALRDILGDRRRWYLSYLDSDTV